MPLLSVDSDSYIRRVRVVVDSDKRDRVNSASPFDFVFELPQRLERVVGAELVGYNVKRQVQRTFEGAVGPFPANNYIDVTYDAAPAVDQKELPLRNYTSVQALADRLGRATIPLEDPDTVFFQEFLVKQQYDSQVDVGETIRFEEKGTRPNASFLFGSGPNAHRSAARVLGFTEQRDVGGFADFDDNKNIFQIELQPHRFLEVRVAEFQELNPMARISLTTTAADSQPLSVDTANSNVRLLSNPRRELRTLTVKMTMADGRPPLQLFADASAGVDLVFDLLVLAPLVRVPRWVDQKLVY